MSVTILAHGQRRTEIRIVTTTDPTTIFSAQQSQRDLIVRMIIFNDDNQNTDFSLSFNDGTQEAKVASASLSGNSKEIVEHPFAFTRSESLIFTASRANTIKITMTIVSAVGANEPPEGFNL